MLAIAGLCLAGWFLPWRMLLKLLPHPGSGPTVPGPEASDLLPRLSGAIYSNAKGQVDAIRLPGLAERRIASPTPETKTVFPSIHSVSEPDRSGRVAYVENRMGQPSTHALRFAERAGKRVRTVFTRPGDALWDHVIGEHLTLTPDGERVAYVRNAKGRQFPGAYLMQGVLELLDTPSGKTTTTRLPALDEGLSWFPDGHQLAFVGAAPRRSAPAAPAGKDGFGAGFAGWDALPVVQILDVRTGKVRGSTWDGGPGVSTDGRRVLVEDMATETSGRFVSRWRLVDVQSGVSTAVTAPGAIGSVLALWPDGTVLYWGLPTAGTEMHHTRNNSPLVGPKLELTLKVGVLNTTRFQTVVPYIDPRATATWGPVR